MRCRAARNGLARGAHDARRLGRDHAAIFREFAVNKLRSEANFADLDANVIGPDRDLDVAFAIQQALQLQHALARQDDLLQLARLARSSGTSHQDRRWPSVATARSALPSVSSSVPLR